MWSRLSGSVVTEAASQLGSPRAERALLSEWWAPAQPTRRPRVMSAEERAVVNEWVAVGVGAPDPVRPDAVDVDLAAMSEWSAAVPSRPADPDLAVVSEWGAMPAGAAVVQRSLALAEAAVTLETPVGRVVRTRTRGTFAVTGLALASGHLTFEGVSFPQRLAGRPSPEGITLTVTRDDNVAPGGLVVMADSGFGPSDEGFTLVLAAAAPGRFHAHGTYEVRLDR